MVGEHKIKLALRQVTDQFKAYINLGHFCQGQNERMKLMRYGDFYVDMDEDSRRTLNKHDMRSYRIHYSNLINNIHKAPANLQSESLKLIGSYFRNSYIIRRTYSTTSNPTLKTALQIQLNSYLRQIGRDAVNAWYEAHLSQDLNNIITASQSNVNIDKVYGQECIIQIINEDNPLISCLGYRSGKRLIATYESGEVFSEDIDVIDLVTNHHGYEFKGQYYQIIHVCNSPWSNLYEVKKVAALPEVISVNMEQTMVWVTMPVPKILFQGGLLGDWTTVQLEDCRIDLKLLRLSLIHI